MAGTFSPGPGPGVSKKPAVGKARALTTLMQILHQRGPSTDFVRELYKRGRWRWRRLTDRQIGALSDKMMLTAANREGAAMSPDPAPREGRQRRSVFRSGRRCLLKADIAYRGRLAAQHTWSQRDLTSQASALHVFLDLDRLLRVRNGSRQSPSKMASACAKAAAQRAHLPTFLNMLTRCADYRGSPVAGAPATTASGLPTVNDDETYDVQ